MTLVLLHAFPLDASMYAAQRVAFPDVVTPSFRGFGGTPLGSDAPSLDVLADDVVQLLDERGIDQVVLGGTSMGGYVAMAFLRRHPDRVSGLVLADTKAGSDPDAARANRLRIASAVEEQGSSALLLEELLPKLLGASTWDQRPEVAGPVRRTVAATSPAAVAWAQRAMADRPGSFETLRAADVPTLVVVGAEDELTPVAEAQAMVDVLPRATLVVLEGAGHLAALERPEAFNAAVTEFLVKVGQLHGS